MASIEVHNVSKYFNKGSICALKNISFEVKPGELFGLIGPDGAGKTTLFRILSTLLLPDEGFAKVLSFDLKSQYRDIRNIVGYMPGKFSLYQDLSIEENLNFFATIFNTTFEENYQHIKDIYVQIEPFKKRLAGQLSGGMKQKLALCCALIHEPIVLFLDEPTTGVDPVSRKEFWDMLDHLKEKNISILVSTPYMDEASRCDRVALMQKGEIMEVDTLENCITRHSQELFAIKGPNKHLLLKSIRAFSGTKNCFAFGDENHVSLKNGSKDLPLLQDFLLQNGLIDLEIRAIKPNIEDTFIKLMLETQSQ